MAAPRTLALWHFSETEDHFGPRDSSGNVGELVTQGPDSITASPVELAAFCGSGRRMNVTNAVCLKGNDVAGGDSFSTRDISVQAVCSIEDQPSQKRYLYQRGKSTTGGASEYVSVAVWIRKLSTITGAYELGMEWQDSGSTLRIAPTATFKPPAGFFLLTVTRRWETATRVVVRYYANDTLLAEVVSAYGDIAGATTGTTYVGGGHDQFGGRQFVWPGVLDELMITDHEMSAEEIAATWARLSRHQPAGEKLVLSLVPPGSVWGDRSTRWGKLFRTAGQAVGFAIATIEELRENFLPHRTDVVGIERWENLHGIAPAALDSLEKRRERVVQFMGAELGQSKRVMRQHLEEPLALASSLIEIMEFKNRVLDDFATLKTERWHCEPAAQWTIAAGALQGILPIAGNAQVDCENSNYYRALQPMSANTGRVVIWAKFSSVSTISDSIAGLHLWNWRTRNGIWLGGTFASGASRIGLAVLDDPINTGDPIQLSTSLFAYGGGTVWIRLIQDPDDDTHWTAGVSTTSSTSGYTEVELNGMPTGFEWAGLGILGLDSSAAAQASVVCDEFYMDTPNGTRPFCWYAYRDPALAGDEDMLLANALVQRIKPSHTHAAAITTKSLKCDSSDSGCDRGPMGGL